MLGNNNKSFAWEQNGLNWEEKYHFAFFSIVNKIWITENCWKLAFNNFLLKYYQLYRTTAGDDNCLFFSYRARRIFFSELFNIIFFHVVKNEKMQLKS